MNSTYVRHFFKHGSKDSNIVLLLSSLSLESLLIWPKNLARGHRQFLFSFSLLNVTGQFHLRDAQAWKDCVSPFRALGAVNGSPQEVVCFHDWRC